MSQLKGKISQIIGPVVDLSFENAEKLPKLLDAIEVQKEDGSKVVLESAKSTLEKTVSEPSLWILLMD